MIFSRIFTWSLAYATIRYATPIIYAALCAAITQQANILNIGTEGIMLVGAFTAVAVSFLTGSWILAVLLAMVAGLVMGLIMAVGHIRYKADNCAIGIGINLFAVAITKFMLNSVLGKSGTFTDPNLQGIPKLHLPFLEGNAILNEVFNNWSITEWFMIVLVALVAFLFYKTAWGLRLRAVGQLPAAAQTAGINVNAMKYQAIIIASLIGGLAGAHLSLGYAKMFTENMTNGRGFMGVAAMYFGRANPVLTAIGCLVFGLADSIGSRLQPFGVPSQIILLMPYVVTITVLAISMAIKKAQEQRKKSALYQLQPTR
ncbi:MAG: ABC transporter permease [Clostridia bacterium]